MKIALLVIVVTVLISCAGRMVLLDDIEMENAKLKTDKIANIDVYSSTDISEDIIKDCKGIIKEVFSLKSILVIDSARTSITNVDKTKVTIEFDIKELKWYSPKYDEVMGTKVGLGFLGGLSGGLLGVLLGAQAQLSSNYTLVYGIDDIELKIKSDLLDTNIVYKDTGSIEINLIDFDSRETKAEARGLALKHTLRKVIPIISVLFDGKKDRAPVEISWSGRCTTLSTGSIRKK
jgi:hypothetical protein